MASLAYQTTNFAYQGVGQFAYQTGGAVTTLYEGARRRRLREILRAQEEQELVQITTAILMNVRLNRRGGK